MTAGRFDALFATLTQQHDSVDALLDSFFDFMHRKTDFYAVSRDPARRKKGFLPGHAQQKVLHAFLKYPFKDLDVDAAPPCAAPAAPELKPTSAVAAPAARKTSAKTPAAPSTSSASSVGDTAPQRPQVKLTDGGKQIPVGNGGTTALYTWTQTMEETTIYLAVPPGTRSRDLDCKITSTQVRVTKKNAKLDEEPLLDGLLPGKVRVDECLWSLERDSTTLQISLEKVKKSWWASALQGHDEIDTSQVESTRAIHEYDGKTQGAIRKIMFDHQQTASGRPTSDEMLQEAILEQAKRALNSPI